MKVLHNQIPPPAVKIAFDHILHLPKEELSWPVHRWHPKVLQLLAYLPAQRGELCDPQIVYDWWDNPSKSDGYTMHKDQPPEWANGRRYDTIYGVALTQHDRLNGAVIFSDYFVDTQPHLNAGDVVEFGPRQEHCTGIFHPQGGSRISVYFRFLY